MSGVFPFFDLYLFCRTAVLYQTESFFKKMTGTAFWFFVLPFFFKPYRNLPEAETERLKMMYDSGNDTIQLWLQTLALYPEITGVAFCKTILSEPAPLSSDTKADIAEALSADFPVNGRSLFADRSPDVVFSEQTRRRFKESVDVFAAAFGNTEKGELCAPVETFRRFIANADFRHIADSMEALKQKHALNEKLFFPEVNWLRTSQHLLTCEPHETKPFKTSEETSAVLVGAAVDMILRDGLFVVFDEPCLKMTETGAVVVKPHPFIISLTLKMRQSVFSMARAWRDKSVKNALTVLINAGFLPSADMDRLTNAVIDTLQENAGLSVAQKSAALIVRLSEEGLVLPPELRFVCACLFKIESLTGNKAVWDEAGEKIDFYVSNPQMFEQTDTTDLAKQVRDDFIKMPPLAGDIAEKTPTKNAAFIDDPKLIADMLKKNEKEMG